jgi:hypothetical protein
MRWREIRARNTAIQHKLHTAILAETRRVAEADKETTDRELSRIMAPTLPNPVCSTTNSILQGLRRAFKIVISVGAGVGVVIGLIDLGKGLNSAVELLLAVSVFFTTGVITGIVLLVSAASRREDRRAKLSREAPDAWSQAGRFLTGLYVRRPGDDRPGRSYPDDAQSEFAWSDYEPEDGSL